MAKTSNTKRKPKEKLWYFYVYATGHGIPSHLILHVGYSEQSSSESYPTWFSEGVSLETAHKIYEKVKWNDGTAWSGSKAFRLQQQISCYIQLAKEGNF